MSIAREISEGLTLSWFICQSQGLTGWRGRTSIMGKRNSIHPTMFACGSEADTGNHMAVIAPRPEGRRAYW